MICSLTFKGASRIKIDCCFMIDCKMRCPIRWRQRIVSGNATIHHRQVVQLNSGAQMPRYPRIKFDDALPVDVVKHNLPLRRTVRCSSEKRWPTMGGIGWVDLRATGIVIPCSRVRRYGGRPESRIKSILLSGILDGLAFLGLKMPILLESIGSSGRGDLRTRLRGYSNTR